MRIARIATRALCGLGLFLVAGMAFGQNLTFGSWRTDDVAKWTNIIAAFNKTNPNIKITFDPTAPADYNATLRLQLDNGNGPDLFFARSFSVGKDLFKAGYELDLTNEAFIKTGYAPSATGAFSTDDHKVFALPAAAVSHGIYYNKDLFAKYGVAVPKTWPELIAAAKKLQAAGVTPFGNGLAGNWDILEVVLMNILPSAVGGADGRMAYESGKRKLNDASIVAAFAQLKELAPYLPKGFEAVTDTDATNLFKLGKAAMVFWGSWDIPDFSTNIKDFQWSVFACPPAAGKANVIEFMPDFGIAINPKSKNVDAAKKFLAWLSGNDGGKAIGENLVGFFPMSKAAVTLSNPYANTFLSFNKGTTQDFRFTWDKLSSNKLPSYTLLLDQAGAVLKGTATPQQAADAYAKGMADAGFKP